MAHNLKWLIFFTLVTIILYSCKKEEKSIADSFVGTYLVNDTLVVVPNGPSCGPSTTVTSYLMVVTKLDDNTVEFVNHSQTSNIKVTLTKTTLVSTGSWVSINGSYSGKTFTASYDLAANPSCNYFGSMKGVKQD